jgi:tRNA-specific 2-thiouridylase
MNKERVVVAMSGGVDSSVAAALLVNEGYDVVGITMKTWGFMEVGGAPKHESGCCSLDAIYDAKNVAQKLGIPHYTVDFTEAFEKEVIGNFIEEYLKGHTPNPCVLCNKKIKWEEMLQKADDLDARYIATGHYAFVEYQEALKRYAVRDSADIKKNQSYVLWGLSQESLSRTLLPLGKYSKDEVRVMAEKMGLKTANKPDSQEICFVADDDYERFIRERLKKSGRTISEGDIIFHGKKVARHKGIPFYTIGQRKGLGISNPKPLYVKKIIAEDNTIEIGEKEEVYSNIVSACSVNYVGSEDLKAGENVICKIRYSDKGTAAEVIIADKEKFSVKFSEPKSAVTPGQSAVIYDFDGYLLAGGIIVSAE